MTKEQSEYLKDLSEIRNIMDRSTRFISLSGIAGVFAGVWAIIGAYIAYLLVGGSTYILNRRHFNQYLEEGTIYWLIADALGVLLLAVASGIFFSMRKAKKEGSVIWSKTTLRLFVNMALPLACGGVFCLVLIVHHIYGLVAPTMLIFYGLALFSAGKYTLGDVRSLGLIEIFLGFLNCAFIGYGIYFWAVGFGVMHIIYGIVMYYKYEREER